MTDDPGVKDMLKFNLARDTVHQNQWLAAIEQLREDGLEGVVVPGGLEDEEHRQHAQELWHLSDGTESGAGLWASGPAPDGEHELTVLTSPQPLGDKATVPPPDPKLYATYDGSRGKPKGPVLGTETGVKGKIKDALTPDE